MRQVAIFISLLRIFYLGIFPEGTEVIIMHGRQKKESDYQGTIRYFDRFFMYPFLDLENSYYQRMK